MVLPGWMTSWFYFSGIVCIYDASFVIFRPLTLPGGPLFPFFYPYKYYIPVDQRYKNVDDSYSFTQSWLNYAESIMYFYILYLHYRGHVTTRLWALVVSVMTFWKTVLYLLMFLELAGGQDYRQGNTFLEEIFIVAIPNGVWVVVPFICMLSLWPLVLMGSGDRRAGGTNYVTADKSKRNAKKRH